MATRRNFVLFTFFAAVLLWAGIVLRARGAGALPPTAVPPGAQVSLEEKVDFNRDVRPILSNTCFKCHGMDEGSRKAKLRLDVREGALKPSSSGEPAIVPGKPDKSEAIRRVLSADDEELMPPPSAKLPLTDAQKQTLKRWVADGAEYTPHWAYVVPKQAPIPAVRDAGWVRNPIDAFILARLEREGLTPSPEADRYALIRRVSLDLIGLPPTPAEADAFVQDKSPDAYEKLVDRLLASPHYGERWARRWLDLARYADTNGYEKDRPRSIWPYRDWVIQSMNADMPFDEFTIEQLAGDMLPNATVQQKVATGFHRNTMLNEEGGIDALEYRFLATVDRVGTTGTTWLGLTVACAQCHTHKYDPIRQSEYYQLMALLNNADEPELAVTTPQIEAHQKEAQAKAALLTAALPDQFPVTRSDPAKWETPPAIVTAASNAVPEAAADGSWRFTGANPERDVYTLKIDSSMPEVDRIRLDVLRDGAGGPGRTPHGNFVLSEINASVTSPDAPEKPIVVKFARAEADYSQKDFPVAHAIDGDRATGWAIDDGTRPTPERSATFYFDKPMKLPKGGTWKIKLDQNYGEQHTIARLRLSLGAAQTPLETPTDQARRDALARAIADWEKSLADQAVNWTIVRPTEMASTMPQLVALTDGSVLARGDITKSDSYDLTFRPGGEMKDFTGVTAVRLEVLPDDSLPRHGPGKVFYEGSAGDFFLSEITLAADGKPAKFARAAQSFAAGGADASKAIDGNQQTGWSIDGAQGKPNVAVFALAEPLTAAKELKLRLLFEKYFAASLGHFRVSITTDSRAANPTWKPALLRADVEAALAAPPSSRTAAQQALLSAHFLSVTPLLADARKQIAAVLESAPKPPTSLVMAERPASNPRLTHLHHRGEFLQPQEVEAPGVPAFLPPLPADVPANRLTFARWLVSGENPLTARVAVNRQWAALFGRGIVSTTENFGYQGSLPTHPELLDWLAVDFVKEGWSMKKLHRLIVTSATYRQASRVTPELAARDPLNTLLARGPRFRMDAELVRDAALRASGLLSEKLGGPSVFPPQPAAVTNEGTYGAMSWNVSSGEDRYRRSLYTFMKRSSPFALYGTFDGPTGETCLARRDVSNTPLQALALLNDMVFLEAAQATGRSFATAEPGADEARAGAIFRSYLTRPASPDELALLAKFAAAQRHRFAAKELDAAKIAGPGPGDVVERATWTTVARAIMNFDEAVTR